MAEADIDPLEDPEEYFSLFRILKGPNEDGTVMEWTSRDPNDVESDLQSWFKGSANRTKNHGTFLMMAPVDHCIKKGKNQYHIFAGPNIKYSGTSFRPEEIGEGDDKKTFYDAMAFAAMLMSQFGRVWTNEIWQKVGDSDPEAYPFLCEQEFRSTVLCVFQASGHTFAFGLCEDAPNNYGTFKEGANIDKSLGKRGRKYWKTQRARNVGYCYGAESLSLQKGQITGLNAVTFTPAKFMKFTQLEELSGPNIEDWVAKYISTLDH